MQGILLDVADINFFEPVQQLEMFLYFTLFQAFKDINEIKNHIYNMPIMRNILELEELSIIMVYQTLL